MSNKLYDLANDLRESARNCMELCEEYLKMTQVWKYEDELRTKNLQMYLHNDPEYYLKQYLK